MDNLLDMNEMQTLLMIQPYLSGGFKVGFVGITKEDLPMANYSQDVLLAYADYAIDHFVHFGGFPCEFEFDDQVYNSEECHVMRQDLRLTKLHGYHVTKDA